MAGRRAGREEHPGVGGELPVTRPEALQRTRTPRQRRSVPSWITATMGRGGHPAAGRAHDWRRSFAWQGEACGMAAGDHPPWGGGGEALGRVHMRQGAVERAHLGHSADAGRRERRRFRSSAGSGAGHEGRGENAVRSFGASYPVARGRDCIVRIGNEAGIPGRHRRHQHGQAIAVSRRCEVHRERIHRTRLSRVRPIRH